MRTSPIALLAALLLCSLFPTPQTAHAAEPSALRLPDYRTVKLDNGITVLLLERHALPMVNLEWVMKSGGAAAEPANREGLASLTAELLRKGTQSRSAAQIAETLDFVGASWDAGAGQDAAVGSCECVSKDLDLMLDMLSDLLQHPTFPAREVAKLVDQRADGIKQEKEVPNEVIGRYYDHLLFGRHPYGRAVSGTETSLHGLKRKEVSTFYQRHYGPEQLVLAAVGDFTASELEAKLKARLGGWKPKGIISAPLTAPEPLSGRKALIIEKPDATQTFFRFGGIGLAYANPDRVPVEVVNTLFGGRFTSMLNRALRIDSGLTYGAKSEFLARRVPGAFAIGSYTPGDKTGQAMKIAMNVLEQLHRDGITAEQLDSAKTYIKGLAALRFETNDQLAETLCDLELYGLDRTDIDTYFARIDALTVTDAKRIIERYFPLKDLAFVFIGQPAAIKAVAETLADKVETKPVSAAGF
jgi:DNA-directed RNA polymerase